MDFNRIGGGVYVYRKKKEKIERRKYYVGKYEMKMYLYACLYFINSFFSVGITSPPLLADVLFYGFFCLYPG